MEPIHRGVVGRYAVVGTFLVVLGVSLALVALAGTDIPFHDQWNIEGQWLYPAWIDGTLRGVDLFRPINEHRIVWTNLLNLGLFAADGQWDPLVQSVAIALLRSGCAALLTWQFAKSLGTQGPALAALIVIVGFLPHLAWHSVLWGIESHTYFAIGFSWAAFVLLGGAHQTFWRSLFGFGAAVAAAIAMAPGELVGIVLLGLWVLRAVENGHVSQEAWKRLIPLLVLIALASWLHSEGARDSEWRPKSIGEFLLALGKGLGWPHVGSPAAAVVMNLPLGLAVVTSLARIRRPSPGEDFVLLIGGWSAAIAFAMAWARGGGPELAVGVPSRYVDFLVGLPLANVWALIILLQKTTSKWRIRAKVMAAAWLVFVFVGWLGISTEVMTRLILPRMRDRDAPVRLAREFQRSYDPGVFAGAPRLYIPHPSLDSVRSVLTDPRLHGRLPPSLQPGCPMGPFSSVARWLLGRSKTQADVLPPSSNS